MSLSNNSIVGRIEEIEVVFLFRMKQETDV